MKPVLARCYLTLLQIIALLCGGAFLSVWYREFLLTFFQTTQSGVLGLMLNGGIIALFLLGLLRIIWLVLDYVYEQRALNRFIQLIQDGMTDASYALPENSWINQRLQLVSLISQQNGTIDQAGMAANLQAASSAQFTLVRFVNNTLILTGVFGTIISLSIALVGASHLLDAPEDMKQMGAIIGGMSTALSTTVTAIVCFVIFSYLHLRLQASRTQLLANVEYATMAYLLPRYEQRYSEEKLLRNIAHLTEELRQAAETINRVQDRFLQAGERLHAAVDNLQTNIQVSDDHLRGIRHTLREGFRLPEYERDQRS